MSSLRKRRAASSSADTNNAEAENPPSAPNTRSRRKPPAGSSSADTNNAEAENPDDVVYEIKDFSDMKEERYMIAVAAMAPQSRQGFVDNITALAPEFVKPVIKDIGLRGVSQPAVYCVRELHTCAVRYKGIDLSHRGVVVFGFNHNEYPSDDLVSGISSSIKTGLSKSSQTKDDCILALGHLTTDAKDITRFADNIESPRDSVASQPLPFSLATAQGPEYAFAYCQLTDAATIDSNSLAEADYVAAQCLRCANNYEQVMRALLEFKRAGLAYAISKLLRLCKIAGLVPAAAAAPPAHGGDAWTLDSAAESNTAYD